MQAIRFSQTIVSMLFDNKETHVVSQKAVLNTIFFALKCCNCLKTADPTIDIQELVELVDVKTNRNQVMNVSRSCSGAVC